MWNKKIINFKDVVFCTYIGVLFDIWAGKSDSEKKLIGHTETQNLIKFYNTITRCWINGENLQCWIEISNIQKRNSSFSFHIPMTDSYAYCLQTTFDNERSLELYMSTWNSMHVLDKVIILVRQIKYKTKINIFKMRGKS